MYFKDELPPPRYTLDGDFADTELPYTEEHEFFTTDFSLADCDLILLAPKCTSLLSPQNGRETTQFGSATIKTTLSPKNEQINTEFYEVEVDNADFVHRESHTITFHRLISAKKPTIVGILPVLNNSQAAFAGKHLIKQLTPRSLTLVTPGQSFMDTPVCYLASSRNPHAAKLSSSLNINAARPPVLVPGIGAAAVSQAQQVGIPALALVLNSDGPPNHEILAYGSLEQAFSAVSLVINGCSNPQAKVERDISELYV